MTVPPNNCHRVRLLMYHLLGHVDHPKYSPSTGREHDCPSQPLAQSPPSHLPSTGSHGPSSAQWQDILQLVPKVPRGQSGKRIYTTIIQFITSKVHFV